MSRSKIWPSKVIKVAFFIWLDHYENTARDPPPSICVPTDDPRKQGISQWAEHLSKDVQPCAVHLVTADTHTPVNSPLFLVQRKINLRSRENGLMFVKNVRSGLPYIPSRVDIIFLAHPRTHFAWQKHQQIDCQDLQPVDQWKSGFIQGPAPHYFSSNSGFVAVKYWASIRKLRNRDEKAKSRKLTTSETRR